MEKFETLWGRIEVKDGEMTIVIDDIECIDAIRAVLTPEQFEGYCRGNAMKYLWRAGKKVKPGQTVEEAREEDLAKARWYLDTVIKQRETNRELARLADWAVAAMKEILAKARKDGADHD